ncbi:hypothetical protein DB347_13535 [Opitutaceae bacterium EW11]|nr:hypothetical protein DB347_13535 [Opitutaceae bacterium EW11]
MKWLQGTWVRRYNGYRKLVGRPFQGRFKALLVEPGHALEQVCHYIHLNPVRAGVVRFDNYFEFRRSSIAAFRKKNRPEWLEPGTVLRSAGQGPNRTCWQRYVDFLEVLSTDPVLRTPLCSKHMSRGWCLGGREFRKAKTESLRALVWCRKTRFDGVEPAALQDLQRSLWKESLERFARAAKVNLGRLPLRKSAPEKMLLCAAMKAVTSASNAWLAGELQTGAPGGLSVQIKRWQGVARHREVLERLLATFPETRCQEPYCADPASPDLLSVET